MSGTWITVCVFGMMTVSQSTYTGITNLAVKGGEYCNHDVFQANCPDDHVIQMVNGSLGRMRVGECVRETPNPACDVDVLAVLHRNCSGVTRCRLEVSTIDKLMLNLTSASCSQEYRLYLEAYYRCVPVETEPSQTCRVSSSMNQFPIRVMNTEGNLASVTTIQTSKGSDRCPWHIRGQPGQTVQISLLDTHSTVSPGDGVCQIYAYIKEGSISGTVSKLMDCGYDEYGPVYNSLSQSVLITIVDTIKDRNFVLHYKAMGCPDILPEGGSQVLRQGNMTYVTCDDVMWQLECVDNEWLGELGECNMPPVNQAGPLIPWPKSWGQEMTIVMIISVAVVIAVMIVVVGVCIVRRRAGHHFLPVSQNGGEYGVYGMPGPVVPGKCYYPSLPHNAGNQCGASGSESSHYTTTMERRQAIPPNGVTPSGETFPARRTLFLQQQDVTSCSSCPAHVCDYPGTYHDRVGASGWQTFPIRRPEHIYSSPKLSRKDYPDLPYYHELDPQEVERQLREQQLHEILRQRPPPSIPVPPIPQEDELDSEDSGDILPSSPCPPPPPLPPDNPTHF